MSEKTDMIFQWAGVVILIAFAVVYFIRKFRKKDSSCCSCELRDSCSKSRDRSGKKDNAG